MVETIGLTNTFAFLIGIYFLAAGLGVLLEPGSAYKIASQLARNPMMSYLSGFAAFGVGGAIVATHNEWSGLLPGFVTLVGWIALIEGALLFAFRERFVKPFLPLGRNVSLMRAMGGVIAVFGAILIVFAFAA